MSDNWIRVSEIVEYVYCRRAWWLRRIEGHTSRNVTLLAQGTAFHHSHGRRVRRSIRFGRAGYALLAVAILAFVLALLVT